MAQLTGMHQPYISLLESGLLPQRGPSIHALTRYVQSANCDLELVARSRETGNVVATLSSADIDIELGKTSSGLDARGKGEIGVQESAGRQWRNE